MSGVVGKIIIAYVKHRRDSVYQKLKTSTQEVTKSEIYSVGNFDQKFDAKQALEYKKNS